MSDDAKAIARGLSDFGEWLDIPMPPGDDMIIVCADRYAHVPVWLGLRHQLYVETAENLMRENFCTSLTIFPVSSSEKVTITAEALRAEDRE